MAEKRTYSNSRRTIRNIKDTLITLLKDNDISDITIINLVKVAKINRATFYVHYRSINAVIADIEQDVRDKYTAIREMFNDVDIFENTNHLIDVINKFIVEDYSFFKGIINTNIFNRMSVLLGNLLNDIIINNLVKYKHLVKNDNSFYLNISMFTGGLIIVYRDWIINSSSNASIDVVTPFLKEQAKNLLKI